MSETAAINIPKRRVHHDVSSYTTSSSSASSAGGVPLHGTQYSTRPTITSTSSSSTTPGRSVSSSGPSDLPYSRRYRASASDSSPTSSSSIYASSDSTPATDKGKVRDVTRNQRRASLLGESISKSEHTVVDIGDPEGPPRLITCVKTGQGFDWNLDIFLPSYAYDHSEYSAFDLERRQDPAEEIFITEEEAEQMFPR